MAPSAALLAMVKGAKNKFSRGGNSIKLKEGKTTVRILQKGDEKFWEELGVHWIKTEKDGKPVAVVGCRDEVYGEPCEICTAIAQAAATVRSDEDLAIIKEWKAKKSALVVALIRSGPDKSEEPQIVELTGTTFADVLSTWETYLNDEVNIFDPDTGTDFVIERSGRGFDTKYRVQTAPKSAPVNKEVLDRLPDLKAHIEKEYFRGDEKKALLAIANMTGINVTGLVALTGPKTATAGGAASRLTSSVVEDADVVEVAEIVEAEADAVEEVEVAELEVAETDEEREEREFAELVAKRNAAKAAKAAKEAAAKAVVTKPATTTKKAATAAPKVEAPKDDFGAKMDQSEIDDMLAGLDG